MLRTRAIALLVAVGCAHAHAPPDGRIELSRARVALARGKTQEAIALYERVPRFSPAWPRALFEGGREVARANRYSAALGMFMTLHAPQLANWVFPEAYAIEAEIYLRNCHFERALAVAHDFRANVLPLRDRVMTLVGGAPIGREVPWIATRLAGATAAERWDHLDQLLVELDLADAVLARVEQAVAEQRSLLVDVGRQSFELVGPIVGDEHHLWKFDGDYWPDELGNYRVPILSRCERRRR